MHAWFSDMAIIDFKSHQILKKKKLKLKTLHILWNSVSFHFIIQKAMASVMEQTPYSSRRHDLHHEAAASDSSRFNLREWALKARMISRENTNSRRFSASNIRSFREDTRSFRSNITISSTASSPGYPLLRGNQ